MLEIYNQKPRILKQYNYTISAATTSLTVIFLLA